MTTFIDKIRGTFDKQLPPSPSHRVPADARKAFNDARQVVTDLHNTAAMAASRVAQLRADDTLYPEGRERMARETIADARERASALALLADAAISLAGERLIEAALPRLDVRRAHLARQDAMMILDSLPPEKRAEVMVALGERDDEVTALVASRWGRDYLEYRTPFASKASTLHEQIRSNAAMATVNTDDGERRAAADAYLNVSALETAYGVAKGEVNALA